MPVVPGPCASESGEPVVANDTEVEVYCDVQADLSTVPFLRRYVYNSLGGFVSSTDTQLDGVTTYVPTGTEQVPCDSLATLTTAPIALTTRNRTLQGAGGSAQWTPADVAGTLVSLTWVVMSGTGGVAQDSNGTNARAIPGFGGTWAAEDANEILPPNSITVEVGSTIYVNWTERP